MIMLKSMGIFGFIPTMVLLTISFFVMVILKKLEEGALKSFGRIIAMLLCAAALMIFTMGLYAVSAGYCPITKMLERGGLPPTRDKMMHRGIYKPMMKMHKGMCYK